MARLQFNCWPWRAYARVLLLLAATCSIAATGNGVGPMFAHGSLASMERCGAALMQHVASTNGTGCTMGGPQEDALREYLARTYATCLYEVQAASQEQQLDVKMIGPTNIARMVSELLVNGDVLPQVSSRLMAFGIATDHIQSQVLAEVSTNVMQSAAGWILPSWVSKRLDMAQVTADVPQVADWLNGIPPYFQRLATAGDPYFHHVPLDGSVNLLYYRSDVLQAKGWKPPATWDELIVMAAALNGTDLNEDGVPDWGFCMEPVPDCTYAHLVGAVFSPMTQTHGMQHGAVLNPDCLKPLFHTPAFQRALEQLSQLMALSPSLAWTSRAYLAKLPEWHMQLLLGEHNDKRLHAKRSILSDFARDEHCSVWGSTLFHQGRCAFTMGGGHVWKVAQVAPPGSEALADSHSDEDVHELQRTSDDSLPTAWYVRGRLGSSVLPGASQVLNRQKNLLVACDTDTCPHAELVTPSVEVEALSQSADEQGGVLVNRAPYSPSVNFLGTLSSEVPAELQVAASLYWMALASEAVHNQLALSAHVPEIVPMRSELLSLDALPRYVEAGYDEHDTRSYIQAVLDTLAHPNIVPSPAIPGADRINELMHEGARQVSAGEDPEAVSDLVHQRVLRQVLMYLPDMSPQEQEVATRYREVLLAAYQKAIGYDGSLPGGAPPTDSGILIVTIMIPVTCTAVVVLLSILYEARKHAHNKTLLGKVLPPGATPETTLLVTDIESSTTLWELLPPWVMDVTLQQHHACIRTLLLKHNGYESATEGDSFIIAFHCPEEALLFAMECQVALLDCPWPAELLECEQCAPYYVMAVDTGKRRLAPMSPGVIEDEALLGERLTAGEYRIPEVPSSLADMVEPLPLLYSTTPLTGDRHTRTLGLPGVNGKAVDWASFQEEYSPRVSEGLPTNTRPRLYSIEGGQSTASSPMGEHTFQSEVAASWKPTTPGTHNAFLIFRGLRVRMGMASGVFNAADVVHNKAAARTHYTGDVLMTAKAVCDAASGGAILLTETACSQLPTQHLWDKALIMHVGEYQLTESLPVLDLYQVTGRRLLGRIPHLNISRCTEVVSRGVLGAPVGNVAIANVMAVGAKTLLSWNETVAKEALDLFLSEVMQAMPGPNPGYLAEVHVGQISISFPLASEAIVWGLNLHQALLHADWSPALLDQSVCEEVIVNGKRMFRGLRVKVGIDSGEVIGEIQPRTARCQYRGWPVLRSLRIMQAASSNQVLCSRQCWSSANLVSGAPLLAQYQVTAEPFGFTKVKGVLDRVELYQCRLVGEAGTIINKGRNGKSD